MIALNDIGAAAFVVARQADGTLIFEEINAAAERMTGLANATTRGKRIEDVFAPDTAAMLKGHYQACLSGRKPLEFERLVRVPRGEIATRTTLTPLLSGQDVPQRLLGVSVDITEHYRLQQTIETSNARLGIAMEALGGAHWYYDPAQKHFELSPGFDRILGPETPRGMGLDEWLVHVHPDDRNDTCFADIMAGRIEQGTAEFRVLAGNGDVRWLRCRRRAVANDASVNGIAGVVVDITQEKRREAVLSLQAASDPLTGLGNRRRFEEVFQAERDEASRRRGALSLLMIDVDNFKAYNDTYGHIAGDAVLKRIAGCLQSVIGAEGGSAARYGGEEFVAVLPGKNTAAASTVAETILSAVRQLGEPHRGSGSGIVSVSIGVAGHPRVFGQVATNLVALADAALYRAKHDGRDCYRVVVPTPLEATADRSDAA